MTVKAYAAIMTGALAMVVTAFLLWVGTDMLTEGVIVFSLAAYYAGIVGAYEVIDWMERRGRKTLTATIITLVREEQGRGKEAQDVDGCGDREGVARA